MTAETFLKFCKRRFGTSNPQRSDNPVWEWMVRRGGNPFIARESLGLEDDHFESEGPDFGYGPNLPDWCFDRFGMTRTRMPDGRIICIAGQHEDSYDPDFCIYNDVIVLTPNGNEAWVTLDTGKVEIYTYPLEDFTPTDHHATTRVGDSIYIIGNWGYPDHRKPGTTPVHRLDTETYRIDRVHTTGEHPGWIRNHHASYEPTNNAIIVRGSSDIRLAHGSDDRSTSSWRLKLETHRWIRVKESEPQTLYNVRWSISEPNVYPPSLTREVVAPSTLPFEWIELGPLEEGDERFQLDICGVRVEVCDAVGVYTVRVEGPIPERDLRNYVQEIADRLFELTWLGPGGTWKVEGPY
ncbi:MAG: hypothetical protein AAGD00_00820 [Planctomycetota bacterium]